MTHSPAHDPSSFSRMLDPNSFGPSRFSYSHGNTFRSSWTDTTKTHTPPKMSYALAIFFGFFLRDRILTNPVERGGEEGRLLSYMAQSQTLAVALGAGAVGDAIR